MKLTSRFIFLSLFSIVFIVASCNGRQTAVARIFERKHIEGNQLLVKYAYKVEGKEYQDSAVIKNAVINSDTITINFSKSAPAKSSFTPNSP